MNSSKLLYIDFITGSCDKKSGTQETPYPSTLYRPPLSIHPLQRIENGTLVPARIIVILAIVLAVHIADLEERNHSGITPDAIEQGVRSVLASVSGVVHSLGDLVTVVACRRVSKLLESKVIDDENLRTPNNMKCRFPTHMIPDGIWSVGRDQLTDTLERGAAVVQAGLAVPAYDGGGKERDDGNDGRSFHGGWFCMVEAKGSFGMQCRS